jgi:FixJ family two-component response regulator
MIRVLHAEDDPQVAALLRLAFACQAPDCAVTTVESGRACLELAELAARRDPTPVIMVSGLGQTELAVRALRAGAVDCVDKNSPDFRHLPARMKGVLERHRQSLRSAATSGDAIRHRVLWLDPAADPAATTSLLATHAPSRF